MDIDQTPGDGGGQKSLACCTPMGLQRVEHNLMIEHVHSKQNCLPTLKGASVFLAMQRLLITESLNAKPVRPESSDQEG